MTKINRVEVTAELKAMFAKDGIEIVAETVDRLRVGGRFTGETVVLFKVAGRRVRNGLKRNEYKNKLAKFAEARGVAAKPLRVKRNSGEVFIELRA